MKFLKFKYEKGDLQPSNFLMLTIAGIINAAGVTLFLAPVNLYDSGVSGLSMFLDMLIAPMPLWSWLLIINFPIFLFGMKRQGVAFTAYSLYAILIYSLTSMVFQNIIPVYCEGFFANGSPIAGKEVILCSVFGGMLSGIGSGMTIRYGGTMDGMETLAVIFSKRLNMTVGNFVMIFNVILYITIGATVMGMGTGDFTVPLFSIIAYYVNGKAVDFISQGIDQAKGAIIITTESALSTEFGRGLTIIDAKGYYSQSDKKFIYCVVNRFQVAKLRTIVSKYDKHAFVTINDIADVFGTSVKNSRLSDKRRREKLQKLRQEARHEQTVGDNAAIQTAPKDGAATKPAGLPECGADGGKGELGAATNAANEDAPAGEGTKQ